MLQRQSLNTKLGCLIRSDSIICSQLMTVVVSWVTNYLLILVRNFSFYLKFRMFTKLSWQRLARNFLIQ